MNGSPNQESVAESRVRDHNGEARDNGREGLRKQEQSQETWRTFTNWKRYSQDITNSIWNLSPGYGILLDEVEGSRKVLLWS
jgi:hypothetical protein